MAELRSRRSNLAVPGSNPRFLEKAKGLPADQVFLDLEDACAPLAKPGARKNIVAALNEGGWGDKIRTVRVNDWTTEWTFQDVLEVVGGAGAEPRLHHAAEGAGRRPGQGAGHAAHPDREGQRPRGRADRHRGADRDAQGLINVNDIAVRQRPDRDDHLRAGRLHGVSINMKSLVVGAAPGLPGRPVPLHPHADPHGRPCHAACRRSTARSCRCATSTASRR